MKQMTTREQTIRVLAILGVGVAILIGVLGMVAASMLRDKQELSTINNSTDAGNAYLRDQAEKLGIDK